MRNTGLRLLLMFASLMLNHPVVANSKFFNCIRWLWVAAFIQEHNLWTA